MLLQTVPRCYFFLLLASYKEVDLWLLACAAPAAALILRNSLQFGRVVVHGLRTEILRWTFVYFFFTPGVVFSNCQVVSFPSACLDFTRVKCQTRQKWCVEKIASIESLSAGTFFYSLCCSLCYENRTAESAAPCNISNSQFHYRRTLNQEIRHYLKLQIGKCPRRSV